MLDRLRHLILQVEPHIPFTVGWGIRRALRSKPRSVLDVGCGNGERLGLLYKNRINSLVVGVDIFEPWLRVARDRGSHDGVILADCRWLPLRRESFDAVVCMEVIEHLQKEDGVRLLAELEHIARRKVVITAPNKEWRLSPKAWSVNPYQRHLSSWSHTEIKQLGYQVRGSGLHRICDDQSLLARVPLVWHVVWVLGGLVGWFVPRLAGNLICVKSVSRG